MFSFIFSLIETWKCRRGIDWLRPWNRDIDIFKSFNYKRDIRRDYLEQIFDGSINTMLKYAGYKDEFIDWFFNQSPVFIIFLHDRIDEKNRKFEGVTLSFGLHFSKNSFDRIDLILEDIAQDGIFDGEVNQVRLYISKMDRYLSNDYDLLYWDASDKRSLELFQTAYQDAKIFAERDNNKITKFNKFPISNFKKRTFTPKGSSFSGI